MKHYIYGLFSIAILFSQPKFVKSAFKSNRLINMSTTEQLYKGNFEFRVGHRFGDTYYGIQDMFGLDQGASTAIGFDFALSNSLTLGAARMSKGKVYEINTQYRLFRQKRKAGMPLNISLLAAYNKGTLEGKIDQYFLGQILLSRKFSRKFSLQISPFFIQRMENTFNIKDRPIGAQDIYGLALASRFKVTKRTALMFEYALVLNRDAYNENSLPAFHNEFDAHKLEFNTFSLGYNIEAAGHSFQVFITNSRAASLISSLMGTNTDFSERHFYLGFNFTRLFEF